MATREFGRVAMGGSPLRFLLLVFFLLYAGCERPNGVNSTIKRTIVQLRAEADSMVDSACYYACRTEADSLYRLEVGRPLYLARAYRNAIAALEKDGDRSLPMMVAACFGHGFDMPAYATGWYYCVDWLAIDNDVRGFYVRSEGKPDVNIYPALPNAPQVPGTAWRFAAGPVIHNENDRVRVRDNLRPATMLLDASVLERKKILVGLILANGGKTRPVEARIDDLSGRAPNRDELKATTAKPGKDGRSPAPPPETSRDGKPK